MWILKMWKFCLLIYFTLYQALRDTLKTLRSLEKTHKRWFSTLPTGRELWQSGWTEETVSLSEGMRVLKAEVWAHWVTRERAPVQGNAMCRGKGPKPTFYTHQIKTVQVNQAKQWSPLRGEKIMRGLLGAGMYCSLIWLPVTQVCSVKKWATGTTYKYVHFSVCVSQFNKEVKGFL